ncbi:MAG: anthranilate synthase component I family protein [Bacteroidota bacterium]
MHRRKTHRLPHPPALETALSWCNGFDDAMLLCSHNLQTGVKDPYGSFDMLVAAGSLEELPTYGDPFPGLSRFHAAHKDWLFGHLSYDLKNQIHGLSSRNPDRIGFPEIRFFRPRFVLTVQGEDCLLHTIEHENTTAIEEALACLSTSQPVTAGPTETPSIQHKIDRTSYLEKATELLRHIQQGDIYEVNLCMESFAENCTIDPCQTFLKLQSASPMPYAAFYRNESRYLLCASPERYLAKRNEKLISQPIKGTIRRGRSAEEDSQLADQLRNDPKERSENIMITDLVRNDLSRVASRGSVAVESLLELKTFPRIHQLVTTISAAVEKDIDWTEALRHTFPMGSMTGAPKRSAMQLIDQFEESRRGLYSGCVGYITPEGDFDFNVVIRSIQYNAESGYLSLMAGSALTAGCDPEKEYAECQLKAETMLRALD